MVRSILIIEPASPEFNRGSFCYLSYILYAHLKKSGHKVTLIENFVAEKFDEVKWGDFDSIYSALWSYPQVEISQVISRFCPGPVEFFGYKGLIDFSNLDQLEITDDMIREGIENYFFYFDDFKNILLSDCDMHFKEYDGTVYPLFTSYGCPKGCSFCPTSKNCDRKLVKASCDSVSEVFLTAVKESRTNIHFTDEDFFLDCDRAHRILVLAWKASRAGNQEFCFIALASSGSLANYLRKYGFDKYLNQVKVAEVGYESASEEMLEGMNKKQTDIDYIKDSFLNEIFWLTMTFYPGETISSLRRTGDWMRENGTDSEKLFDRVKGNSTAGGLGQFFQAYPDTMPIDQLRRTGEILTTRPIRLLPSYVPFSFSREKIRCWREPNKEEIGWFDYYRVAIPLPSSFSGLTIKDHVEKQYKQPIEGYIAYAIAAKLGVIE